MKGKGEERKGGKRTTGGKVGFKPSDGKLFRTLKNTSSVLYMHAMGLPSL